MENETRIKFIRGERPDDGIHTDVAVNGYGRSLPLVVYTVGASVAAIAAVAIFITEVL